MNSSLRSADRNTHIKIVVMSLVAAIGVVVVALNARIDGSNYATARIQTDGAAVVKAGNTTTTTANNAVQVR